MWSSLPSGMKEEYKKLILAFASLSELFAQKNIATDNKLIPIIYSKYQETAFQRSFNASSEDIGNTSYDAALKIKHGDGSETKYIVGIKTFGLSSGDQKIAQFKANTADWIQFINTIKANALPENGIKKTKQEIDDINAGLYLELAKLVSKQRNDRIESSKAQLKGFKIQPSDSNIESVYHVLMPSNKNNQPQICIGETSYLLIDIDNIHVEGCSTAENPTNFIFSDGHHRYKYTSADSQLLMSFDNNNIVKEKWDVKYLPNPFDIFIQLTDFLYEEERISNEFLSNKRDKIRESFSWSLLNPEGKIEPYSGLNSFFGVGSKISLKQRSSVIDRTIENYYSKISSDVLFNVKDKLRSYLLEKAISREEKVKKEAIRKEITDIVMSEQNKAFIESILKLLYRPLNEMYIPIPNSKKFHALHPSFFAKDAGLFKQESSKLLKTPEERAFNLRFEPSGDSIKSFITQDYGKAIESFEKQSYLGEWILREVFQLKEYEQLTLKQMKTVGINAVQLFKNDQADDVHLRFLWIDNKNRPSDYWY